MCRVLIKIPETTWCYSIMKKTRGMMLLNKNILGCQVVHRVLVLLLSKSKWEPNYEDEDLLYILSIFCVFGQIIMMIHLSSTLPPRRSPCTPASSGRPHSRERSLRPRLLTAGSPPSPTPTPSSLPHPSVLAVCNTAQDDPSSPAAWAQLIMCSVLT